MRIGPRHEVKCNHIHIVTTSGNALPWVDEIRYLGIFIVRSRIFKCSLDHAKRRFYRSMNGILGKVGRLASEEVVLHLIFSKCMPALLYGLEACSLSKADKASLDFTINRFLMKVFNTGSIAVVDDCKRFFCFLSPCELLFKRTALFLDKCSNCVNTILNFAIGKINDDNV